MQGFFKVPAPLISLSESELADFDTANVVLVTDDNNQPITCPNTRSNAGLVLVAFIGGEDVLTMSLPAGWTIAYAVRETGDTYETVVDIPPGFIDFAADDAEGGRPTTLKEFQRFMGWSERV